MTLHQRDINLPEAELLLKSLSGDSGVGREIADVRFGPVPELAHGARWRPRSVRGVVFKNVDWTHGSILGPLIRRARVEQCRFDGVNVDDFTCRRVDWLDCQFERVTFGESFLGRFQGCTLTRCSFVSCRFDAFAFVDSTLRSCRFAGSTGTHRARWERCLLEDVTFSGDVAFARFIACDARKVDMAEAVLHDVSFHHMKSHDVTFPDRPDNFAIHGELFRVASLFVRSRASSSTAEAYRSHASRLASFGSPFIVDRRVLDTLLEELAPSDRAAVMTTLYDIRRLRPAWDPPAARY